jgi:hypothetical protein
MWTSVEGFCDRTKPFMARSVPLLWLYHTIIMECHIEFLQLTSCNLNRRSSIVIVFIFYYKDSNDTMNAKLISYIVSLATPFNLTRKRVWCTCVQRVVPAECNNYNKTSQITANNAGPRVCVYAASKALLSNKFKSRIWLDAPGFRALVRVDVRMVTRPLFPSFSSEPEGCGARDY